MKYYSYRAEDFASDDDFKKWVCEPDRESEDYWREFLKEYPEKYYEIEEARRLILGLVSLPLEADVPESVSRVWQRLDTEIETKIWRILLRKLSVAAVLLLCLLIGWLGYRYVGVDKHFRESDSNNLRSELWEETVNNTQDKEEVILSDGTVVGLKKSSRLIYERDFNDSVRMVYLTGEAFFEVKKDHSRPFLVVANGLVTKVLGTSFYVVAREGEPKVTVSVHSGRVSVYSKKGLQKTDSEMEGVVLTQNEKVEFDVQTEILRKSLVENPQAVGAIMPHSFAFDGAPATYIFETLSSAYGIEVIYSEEHFERCRLTVDLSTEDLYQKLEVLCKVLDASYKLIDAQVIIYGNGC